MFFIIFEISKFISYETSRRVLPMPQFKKTYNSKDPNKNFIPNMSKSKYIK